jgi:protein-L-isoaspartate(D-aspartate) O-methyltransferase
MLDAQAREPGSRHRTILIGMGEDAARRRARMVDEQLWRRGIRDERVLQALGSIPRERFLPATLQHRAYSDEALGIDAGQTISQPYMVAKMTELLAVQPGDHVLELGTGSGYQAAVLATLGARVTSLERHATLARQAGQRLEELGLKDRVEIRITDGSLGDVTAPSRTYDGIIVTAAAPGIPQQLREQLRDGGRLVIPVGTRDLQTLTLVTRHGNDWLETAHGKCVFVPLVGPGGFPEHSPE